MIDPRTITLDIKGTVKQLTDDSPTTPIKVVYQGTSPQFANYYTKNGKPRMVRGYVNVTNPKTPAQIIQQTRLKNAVAAWHAATDDEKKAFSSIAKTRQITNYMAFISAFILSSESEPNMLEILNAIYPIGAIYQTMAEGTPFESLEFGTWEMTARGRVLVGFDAEDPLFDEVEATGGAKTHTLTTDEIPSHTHIQNAHNHTQNAHSHVQRGSVNGGVSANQISRATGNSPINSALSTATSTATNNSETATNQNTGGGQAHNNLQPYLVCYIWIRTA